MSTIAISILLQKNKLRRSGVKWLAQGYPASEEHLGGMNPDRQLSWTPHTCNQTSIWPLKGPVVK